MSLFEVKNVEKEYEDGTRALRGISFDIAKGEFVSIMGPSGSGKSTILHILGFLDNQTSGEYYFDGRRFNDYTQDEVAQTRNEKMGFIFQMFNLLPRTSVFENVKLPFLYSKAPESSWDMRAKKAIEAVGLLHRLGHETSELSGGERQRVAIARALVNEPPVIFADEPTGNLDTKSGESIMDLLQGLHKKGHTVILITHESFTAEYAERIIHIRDGKVESDKPVNHRDRAKSESLK